jgi:hypothetical protein
MVKLLNEHGVVVVDDDEKADLSSAFVFLKLYDGDNGDLTGRENRLEFVKRQPKCVKDLTPQGATLLVSNSGFVMSDIVYVTYEIVYCVDEKHGPADGFVMSHAYEQTAKSYDDYFSVNVVPPGETIAWPITFRPVDDKYLKNLYFRVRVSTLWSPEVPISLWNFRDDPAVTEAHVTL